MSKLQDSVWQRRPLPLKGIVDMHTHMGAWVQFPIMGGDADAMIRSMDRVGVEKIVCSHQACMSAEVVHGNDQVFQAMSKYPGRILGYVSAFPISDTLGLDEVKRGIDRGMCGIKMHSSNNIPYASEKCKPIWKYADKRRLPVLLHTWGDLNPIEPVFKEYQNVSILLGHAGSVDPDVYVKYAREYKNLYLDLTFSRSKYGLVEYFVKEVSADRVVFGSDMPWMPIGHQLGKVVFADISEKDKKKILVDNPAKILSSSVRR